jgi:putative zinc finger protein
MTDPAMMTTCPTEETLAAFIDGRLEGADRDQVIEHATECADCRDTIVVADEIGTESMDEDHGATVKQFRSRRRYLPVFAAALAASIAVAFFWQPIRDRVKYGSDGGRLLVIKGYEAFPERPVEPRFSDFPYKKIKPTMRSAGTEDGEARPSGALLDAAIALEDADRSRSWQPRRSKALNTLLLGDRDEAVRLMEDAEKAGGGSDPGFLNDLAAVYLARAQFGGADYSGRALAAAERAWSVAKTPESAWNRALALERAGRDADALKAWQEYLAMDSNPDWATEAQGHIKNLMGTPP